MGGEVENTIRGGCAYFDHVCYFATLRGVPPNNNERCEKTTTLVRNFFINGSALSFLTIYVISKSDVNVFLPKITSAVTLSICSSLSKGFASSEYLQEQYHKVSNQVIFLVQKVIFVNNCTFQNIRWLKLLILKEIELYCCFKLVKYVLKKGRNKNNRVAILRGIEYFSPLILLKGLQ